jgi:hypothetical protein
MFRMSSFILFIISLFILFVEKKEWSVKIAPFFAFHVYKKQNKQ